MSRSNRDHVAEERSDEERSRWIRDWRKQEEFRKGVLVLKEETRDLWSRDCTRYFLDYVRHGGLCKDCATGDSLNRMWNFCCVREGFAMID